MIGQRRVAMTTAGELRGLGGWEGGVGLKRGKVGFGGGQDVVLTRAFVDAAGGQLTLSPPNGLLPAPPGNNDKTFSSSIQQLFNIWPTRTH